MTKRLFMARAVSTGSNDHVRKPLSLAHIDDRIDTWNLPDKDVCYRAPKSRDARFDGLIYVGVKSTGIYCRPVCPARTAKFSNCTFYGSAAAAQDAGFRPCLRCRPETAPGFASWRGTSNTVSRALALIVEGALDGDSASVARNSPWRGGTSTKTAVPPASGSASRIRSSNETSSVRKTTLFSSLLELGRGFAFVARQYRISSESKDFYIDLVFYNYRSSASCCSSCYVAGHITGLGLNRFAVLT